VSQKGIFGHFIFSTENAREVQTVISAFKSRGRYPFNTAFRRMGKRKVDEK
jgi:hypothetical protein